MKQGMKVKRNAGGVAFITDISPKLITVRFPNGRLHAVSHADFKRLYTLVG